jgi:hypothetical protein
MTDEIEQKLNEVEAAVTFYRRRLMSLQSLKAVLIGCYNLLENNEAEKRPAASKTKAEEKERK